MRNIIGQTKSGFNIREIMDNKKILLVNLSKGKLGELNAKLLGIIFIMKFQAAAMSRADIPEEQREDFSLYVDEVRRHDTAHNEREDQLDRVGRPDEVQNVLRKGEASCRRRSLANLSS